MHSAPDKTPDIASEEVFHQIDTETGRLEENLKKLTAFGGNSEDPKRKQAGDLLEKVSECRENIQQLAATKSLNKGSSLGLR